MRATVINSSRDQEVKVEMQIGLSTTLRSARVWTQRLKYKIVPKSLLHGRVQERENPSLSDTFTLRTFVDFSGD